MWLGGAEPGSVPDSRRINGRQEWEGLVPRDHSSVKYEDSRVTILQASELCDLLPIRVCGRSLQERDDLSQVVGGCRKAQGFPILVSLRRKVQEDADRGLCGFSQRDLEPTVSPDL